GVAGFAGREPDAALTPVRALEAHEARGTLLAALVVDAGRVAFGVLGIGIGDRHPLAGQLLAHLLPGHGVVQRPALDAQHLQLAATVELAAVVGDVAVDPVRAVVLGHVDDAGLRIDRAGLVDEPPHRLDRLRVDRAGRVARDL